MVVAPSPATPPLQAHGGVFPRLDLQPVLSAEIPITLAAHVQAPWRISWIVGEIPLLAHNPPRPFADDGGDKICSRIEWRPDLDVLMEQTTGTSVGDRNYWSPTTAAEWARQGVRLLAPYRSAKRDPHPRWSARLSRVRYRIDIVFGQLVDRCALKRVWARDLWHLSNRLLRKVLIHTLAVLLTVDLGNPPLHLARVVTS